MRPRKPSSAGGRKNQRVSGDSGKKSFDKKPGFKKKSFSGEDKPFKRERKPFGDKPFSREKRDDGAESTRDRGFSRDSGGSKEPRQYGRTDRSKPFGERRDSKPTRFSDKRSFGNKDESGFKKRSEGGRPSFGERKSTEDRPFNRERKPFGDKPFERRKRDDSSETKGDSGFSKEPGERKDSSRFGDEKKDRSFGERSASRPSRFSDKKSYGERDEAGKRKRSEGDRSSFGERKSGFGERKPSEGGSFRKKSYGDREQSSGDGSERKWNRKEDHEFYGDKKKFSKGKSSSTESVDDGTTRLNKYISNAGICSRREADEMIAAGVISVNGQVVTEMGYKVQPGDEVRYNNETLRSERLMYLLVNKPKDYITTVDDPDNRKTVMSLVSNACKERVYPVGRLDRNTTGLLLFTNDGELARRLTHPSFEVQKVYQVDLDKNLKPSDMDKISEGINLEDGFVKVDAISYVGSGNDKSVVGIELHSGKNRIVRRIFEALDYDVKKLDRVYFAGLSKRDLPRGRWRFLTELEVANLKMITGDKKFKDSAAKQRHPPID